MKIKKKEKLRIEKQYLPLHETVLVWFYSQRASVDLS